MKQQSLLESLRNFDEEHQVKGETIPENERFYRLEVVQTFLKSGMALAKIDYFRSLLERNGARLASRSTLSRIIPVVLDGERKC